MNDNHSYDTELSERIDRLLETGTSSGSDLLDALAASQPQTDAKFANRLEQRLLERHVSRHNRKDNDMDYPEKPKKDHRPPYRRRRSTLLTIAAAVFAMMIVGGAFFMLGASSSPYREASVGANWRANDVMYKLTASAIVEDITATVSSITTPVPMIELEPTRIMPTESPIIGDSYIVTATAIINEATAQAGINLTATAIPPAGSDIPPQTLPVVVAVQDIALGTVITEDILGYFYAPRQTGDINPFTLPDDFAGFYGNMEDIVGTRAAVRIPRFLPIQPDMIVRSAGNSGEDATVNLTIQVPKDGQQEALELHTGMQVTLRASANETQDLLVVERAEIVDGTEETHFYQITLSVPESQAALVRYFIESGFIFHLEPLG